MADKVNQRGYDVVSAANERISVKTTAQSGLDGLVLFNPRTLDQVDRVIVLRVNTEEMQVETLLDKPVGEARQLMTEDGANGRLSISLRCLAPKLAGPRESSTLATEASLDGVVVRELESETIEVLRDVKHQVPVMPVLRALGNQMEGVTAKSYYRQSRLSCCAVRTINETPNLRRKSVIYSNGQPGGVGGKLTAA